jgi:hypothetical protein
MQSASPFGWKPRKLSRVRRIAFLAVASVPAILAGGCAAITGLSTLEKDECATACTDASSADDAAGDIAVDQGGPVGDAGDAGQNALVTGDCGVANTIQNCGGCGQACDTQTSSNAGCTGTTCAYTCKQDLQDCNAAVAPDLDGCECEGKGCCTGNQCQTKHNVGVKSLYYYDCDPLSTFDQAHAIEACTAFTGNGFQCSQANCELPDGGVAGAVICSSGSPSDCVCWQYSGQFVGNLWDGQDAGVCLCPGTVNTPTWD